MKTAYFYYIFALLLFGSNGIIASHIALPSTEIVLYRTCIGSALLLLLFLIKGNRFTFHKHLKSFAFLALSGIAMGLSWMFLYEAYAQIGVSISSLLYYCGPVIVMILSPIFFKEKLTPKKSLGFMAVFTGILLVNGGMSASGGSFTGVLCGLLSAVMYAFMVIFNKLATSFAHRDLISGRQMSICASAMDDFPRHHNKKAANISGLENSLLQLVISFLTVAAFTLLRGGFVIHIPEGSLLPLVFLGLVNTGIGCYLYFSKLEMLPVQTVSILGYIEPLSAVLLSVLLLQESMSSLQIVGALLVLGGAIFAERSQKN